MTEIFKPIFPKWNNIFRTNCYAYALNLDGPAYYYGVSTFNPGAFSGNQLEEKFSDEILLDYVNRDLDVLGIHHFEVPGSYCLQPGEWKIAIFSVSQDSNSLNDDYHFIKQIPSGLWLEKVGINYPQFIGFGSDFLPQNHKLEYIDDCYEGYYKYLKTMCLKLW